MTTAASAGEDRLADDNVDASAPRRRHLVRRILIGIVVAIFAVWLVLFVTKGRFLKHPFERIVGGMVHRQVSVGGDFQLYFAPFQIKFYAERLRISNPDWATKPDLFAADRIDTRIAPLPLIFGHRRLYWLDLANGAVDLEWNTAHDRNTWTFSEEKGGKPFELPRIDRATVAGTLVRYRDPRMRLLTDLDVDTIRSTAARIGQAVGVRGGGTIRSTPFTVSARLLSPDATVNRGKNELVATMRAAGNAVDVSGTLPSLADIEGVPLSVRARGRDLSTLLGIIDVVLPRTRDYRLHAQLVKSGDEYRFSRVIGVAGATDLAGRLTITNGARLHLDSQLATRSLDIIDAAPFIGFNPDTVAEKGVTAAAAETGAATARLLPDAALPVETMRRFDADLKWTIQGVKSRRIPISDVDLTLDLTNGKLTLSPLTFAMARGNVSADAVFDTRPRPSDVRYDIRLAPTPLGRLLAGWGVAEAGTSGTVRGRIQLAGRGDTIHDSLSTARGRIAFVLPAGTLWTRNAELAELDVGTFVQKMFSGELKEPVRINCGLIGFTVRSGVAAADPVLIDTSKNVVLGRGGFSFRTEAIDLAFRADSKRFSLFSGQSPVGIKGTFSAPSLQVVTPQLLTRAGAGLGLAVLATPVAGLLAFIDPGDAKAAACGPVLAGKTAAAQRTTKGNPRTDVGNGQAAPTKRKKFLGIF
ncbi:AsmA family protein [Sphingomonas sp. Mn802worker]|uniref:AsmA family protein n=1 Tax=Sphingomonas sp. Mn802worker TaxID=629773 RepID=UPI0004759EFA|nr:AsmA family protein [Sphingomonas sp. Mn802worker]